MKGIAFQSKSQELVEGVVPTLRNEGFMKTFLSSVLLCAAVAVSACNNSDVVQRAPDHIEIYGVAAPICEFSDADRFAEQLASIETIKRGFDGYIVRKSYRGEGLRIRYSPVERRFRETARSTSPSRMKIHAMYVQLVKADQPGMSDAIDAREQLGPEWESRVSRGIESNCL